jgi:hypothetical protein
LTAIAAGLGSAAIQFCYLKHIAPFRADLGIQAFMVLGILWVILGLVALVRERRRGLWAFAPAPVVAIAPLLLVALFAGCAANAANCL